jgi:hypothetical protein
MKKIILTIAIVLGGLGLFAQPVPPPPSSHGLPGNQPGGGAPIDGGFSILLAMGAIYGASKVYQIKMKKAEE